MNFNRRSLRDDLLFLMVLLLPPIVAGARYVESERQLAHLSGARSEADSDTGSAAGSTRWIVPPDERRSR